MKFLLHHLIPFLPLFCNCQFRRFDSVQFLCSQAHIPAGWRRETRLFTCRLLCIVKVIVTLRLTVSQSVSLSVEPHLGLMTRYLLLFDCYGLVFVGRPLWREYGSALPQFKVKVMLRQTVQSVSSSWNKALIWGLRSDLYYCQAVAGLLMWGALSEERTGLSFARFSQQ
jgi:hypothetical protein